jgi:DNA-damage-inducible protein J
MTTTGDTYDAWFRGKVQEAISDTRPTIPHRQVMDEVQTHIDRKRRVSDRARPSE